MTIAAGAFIIYLFSHKLSIPYVNFHLIGALFEHEENSKCLEAAKKAFSWGSQNPNRAFSNPSDVSTGDYADNQLGDEKLFAGTELFISTGDAGYKVSGSSEYDLIGALFEPGEKKTHTSFSPFSSPKNYILAHFIAITPT